MKINILSPGRFHVLDLARELDALGWDVRFYSFVPTRRAMKFGLPRRCSRSLIGVMAPFLLLIRLFPKIYWFRHLSKYVQDYVASLYMRKCDVLIAMSGSFVYAPKKAKKQGSIVILERGSKHILEQRRILEAIPSLHGTKPVPDINVKRELAGYQFTDYITIASQHVKESFLLHNYPVKKLFINPYGTSLLQFYPTDKPVADSYDVIMVGGWSYRKGCDLIVEAIRKLNLRFLHVGGKVDMEFPMDSNFTHFNSVNQWKLVDYYSQSKVFVLPSREEGLALVQAQALVCGLPIVCSQHTGGRDLREFLEDKKWIIEMPETTIECLATCITEALQLADSQTQSKRNYAGDTIANLTWEAYGSRYNEFLKEITNL